LEIRDYLSKEIIQNEEKHIERDIIATIQDLVGKQITGVVKIGALNQYHK
jgi:hypothetical protein